jgi:hypothetical protein
MPHTEVEFDYDGHTVRIRPVARTKRPGRGTRIAERLVDKGDVRMTTDEIMALFRGD